MKTQKSVHNNVKEEQMENKTESNAFLCISAFIKQIYCS